METIKIAVNVRQSVAIAARTTKCGTTEYHPSDAELSELTAGELSALGMYTFTGNSRVTYPLELDSATVDWTTIHAALIREADKKEAESKAKLAEHEADVARVVAAIEAAAPLWKNLEVWYDFRADCTVSVYPVGDDPRVKAALEARQDERLATEAEALRLRAEHEACRLAAKVAEEQKAADLEAQKTEALASLYAWAGTQVRGAHIPAAVERGYDCKGEAMDLLVNFVMARLDEEPKAVLVEDQGDWNEWSWERRNDPSSVALALEASLEEMATDVQPDLPKHARVFVGAVCRVEYTDKEEDETTKWTAIPVTIKVPGIKERVCLINCE